MSTLEENKTKNAHYHKDVAHLDSVDVYRVLRLFEISDPCLQHAIKKLLAVGKRSGGKTPAADVREAIYSLERWQEMQTEDSKAPHVVLRSERLGLGTSETGR